MFEWKNEYSVGIGSIDGQHQKLFGIAHELYIAMSAGQGKSALTGILDRLVRYTVVHFAHEERLMQAHNYSGFALHKAEHDALTQKVLTFQADLQSGRTPMTVQLLQFLRDWLAKHIKVSDMGYAPYLKEKAVT